MLRLLSAGVAVAIGSVLFMATGPVRGASCSAGHLDGAAALLSGWADDAPGRCRRLRPADIVPPGQSNTSFADRDPAGRPTEGAAGL